jgi:hypothetical protein
LSNFTTGDVTPFLTTFVSNVARCESSAAVAVCGASSRFSQTTLVPASTSTVSGANLNSSMTTASLPPPPEELSPSSPPHPGRSSAAATASAVRP